MCAYRSLEHVTVGRRSNPGHQLAGLGTAGRNVSNGL